MTTQEVVVSQVLEVVVNQALRKGREAEASHLVLRPLKPERVQEWLTARPEWRLHSSGKALLRTREFSSETSAAQYAAFVSSLAASLALPAHIKLRGTLVRLSLYSPRTHYRAPLTENVLEFASQLG